ncbi:hypothetical protein MnTg02_02318 [bacterium MnTg02]|nr:hypothetical protein MnTg02_02318 [bacterium MnTg02]
MTTSDTKHYLATSFCERAARHARVLLYRGDLSDRELEEVRGCISSIERMRDQVPTDNPGLHEAALMRLMDAHST